MFQAPTDCGLRGDYSGMNAQYVVEQDWPSYSPIEHDRWRRLHHRQVQVVRAHASPAFLDALSLVDCATEIPRLERINRRLQKRTGWSLVAVPGLVPNDIFFAHLAGRRFPITRWIREERELAYLVEPDIFHDFFGHVPMLFQSRFADAMQAYGRRGLELDAIHHGRLARLYWYLVEFGLERQGEGLKAFGAGILSSAAETVYAVCDARPHRIGFDLRRILRTRYRIDRFQETYFVLDDFEQMLRAVDQCRGPLLAELANSEDLEPARILPTDRLIETGHAVGI